jgi:hypothetical protein
MDPVNVTPSSLSAQAQAMVQISYGYSVLSKVLDIQAAQGAMLAQMVAQAGGVGQNVDTTA